MLCHSREDTQISLEHAIASGWLAVWSNARNLRFHLDVVGAWCYRKYLAQFTIHISYVEDLSDYGRRNLSVEMIATSYLRMGAGRRPDWVE